MSRDRLESHLAGGCPEMTEREAECEVLTSIIEQLKQMTSRLDEGMSGHADKAKVRSVSPEVDSGEEGERSSMRLLLVEDDEIIGPGLRESLAREGIDTCWTRTCAGGERHLRGSAWDVVILDLTLPDGDGLDLLTWMRREGLRTPVLVLTARDSVEDRVRGLDLGGDDYLAKPFAVPELVSRLRALVRRSAGFASEMWEVGEVRLNAASRRVWCRDQRLELTPREFDALKLLMQNTGRVVTRDDLWDALDMSADGAGSNLLEVYMHHLRRKLGSDFIRTVRGVGYIVGG